MSNTNTVHPDDNRRELREFFYDAWRKHVNQEKTEPLEEQIVGVLKMHPEYHPVLERKEDFINYDFVTSDTGNPFFHMSLHLAIQEQIETDRPIGIRQIYYDLLHLHNNPHLVEHEMMQALAEVLWQARNANTVLGDPEYLEQLKRLV